MRNFNTSFIKNAFARFENEASAVLRASLDPAYRILRLMQRLVRAALSHWIPQEYPRLRAQLATVALVTGLSGGRIVPLTFGLVCQGNQLLRRSKISG